MEGLCEDYAFRGLLITDRGGPEEVKTCGN
jgi:hypothetical protein